MQLAAAARRRDRDRLRGRRLGAGRPGAARRPQRRRAGLLPGPPARLPAGARPQRGGRAARALAARRSKPVIGAELPLERRTKRSTDRLAPSTGKVVLVPETARRHGRGRWDRPGARGGAGGRCTRCGARPGRRLRRLGSRAWTDVEAADLVCLNAGVLAKGDGTVDDYRRILGVNVDGVVFGVQALTPRMREGSAFVVTASLAGLIPMESDPLYVLTKHAVVGYARSMAPLLAPRDPINLVCPGIVRTPMTEPAQPQLDAAGSRCSSRSRSPRDPRRGAEQETGQAWVCQPGRAPAAVPLPERPGPRVEGAEGWCRRSERRRPSLRTWRSQQLRNSCSPTVPAGRVRGQSPDVSRRGLSRRIGRR